jgi:hypothetical protein
MKRFGFLVVMFLVLSSLFVFAQDSEGEYNITPAIPGTYFIGNPLNLTGTIQAFEVVLVNDTFYIGMVDFNADTFEITFRYNKFQMKEVREEGVLYYLVEEFTTYFTFTKVQNIGQPLFIVMTEYTAEEQVFNFVRWETVINQYLIETFKRQQKR